MNLYPQLCKLRKLLSQSFTSSKTAKIWLWRSIQQLRCCAYPNISWSCSKNLRKIRRSSKVLPCRSLYGSCKSCWIACHFSSYVNNLSSRRRASNRSSNYLTYAIRPNSTQYGTTHWKTIITKKNTDFRQCFSFFQLFSTKICWVLSSLTCLSLE